MVVEVLGGATGGSSSRIIIKNTEGEGARFEDKVFLSEAHANVALEWKSNEEITIYYQVVGKVNLVSFRDEAEIKNLNCRDKKG
jgi:exopolysaccharide biosynthesis protein